MHMKFGEYNSPDALRIQLSKYVFEKGYDHNTYDLAFEVISNNFKCQTVIHDEESQRTPKCYVGHAFSQSIHLVKSRNYYDLLFQKILNTTDPGVSTQAEIDLTECFESQRLAKVRNL